MIRRILVVDDHVVVREGLARMFTQAFPGIEVGFAGNSMEALSAAQNKPWDVALLDLNIPGRGGLETLREIKQIPRPPAIVVYTVHPESQFGLKAMQAGADGYVTKDSSAEVLMAAVRQVSTGRKYVSPGLAESLANFVSQGLSPGENMLSDREQQVLILLATGRSPTEISAQLNLSIKTVSTYKTRVLEKLGLHSTADLVRYALEHKLIE